MNKYAAELIGTFVLVLIGCGSAVIAGKAIGVLGIALAFGIAVLAMAYAIGGISGCHINPAITISMFAAGKMKKEEAAGYIVSQCIGAILGAGTLLMIAGGMPGYDVAINGLGQNGYGAGYMDGYSMGAAFIAEVVLTGVFLLVIFGATSKAAPAGFAGMAIGLSLAMIHMVAIPITGTSVNPARSLGPALFAGGNAMSQLPLFIVAPILGGLLAAYAWKRFLEK
jgi:aquaporin Z